MKEDCQFLYTGNCCGNLWEVKLIGKHNTEYRYVCTYHSSSYKDSSEWTAIYSTIEINKYPPKYSTAKIDGLTSIHDESIALLNSLPEWAAPIPEGTIPDANKTIKTIDWHKFYGMPDKKYKCHFAPPEDTNTGVSFIGSDGDIYCSGEYRILYYKNHKEIYCDNHLKSGNLKEAESMEITGVYAPEFLTKKKLKKAVDSMKNKYMSSPFSYSMPTVSPLYEAEYVKKKPISSFPHIEELIRKGKANSSTVVDRIRILVAIGDAIVHKVDADCMPEDELFSKFDQALKNLREDGK